MFLLTCCLSYLYLGEKIKFLDLSLIVQSLWHGSNLIFLVIAIVLLPINIGIEVFKWKATTSQFFPQSTKQCMRAVLSGISIGFFLPNRTGEFIGKALSIPRVAAVKAVAFSMVTSLSQLITTILAGVLAFLCLDRDQKFVLSSQFVDYTNVLALLLSGLLLLFYFNLGKLRLSSYWFRRFKNVNEAVESLGNLRHIFLIKILFLSIIRYFVFSIQYILVCKACGIQDSPVHLLSILAIMYIILTVVPTVTLSELPARGSILVMVYGLLSVGMEHNIDLANNLLLASIIIWIINLLIPAILGAIYIPFFWIFNTNRQ